MIVKKDDVHKKVRVSLRAHQVLEKLFQIEHDTNHEAAKKGSQPLHEALWRPEYADYMIEGTPGIPFGESLEEILTVQSDMENRFV